jgi:ribosome-associated protein
MDDLRVSPGVMVPASAMQLRAVRASGPGGQNVNKVSSKVELRVDLARIAGLGDAARARLLAMTARRRDADGLLVITSQKTRDQHRNLEDARAKLRDQVAAALVAPKRRRATAPSAGSRERRLREKKQRAARKRTRTRASNDD